MSSQPLDAQEPQPQRPDLPAQALQLHAEPRGRCPIERAPLVEMPRQLVEVRRRPRQFPIRLHIELRDRGARRRSRLARWGRRFRRGTEPLRGQAHWPRRPSIRSRNRST
jgi:hypothetical protein